MQARCRIPSQDRDGLLGKNGPRVNSLIHKMNGATCHFNPIIQSLFPSFQSGNEGNNEG